jgi:hypothetical protein
MINDPQQELFIRLKLDIEALGYAVFDGFLPPEDTPYPFVYLGDFSQADTEYKNAVCGSVSPTIHIWSDTPKKRGTLSQMMLAVKTVCRRIEKTDNFGWIMSSMNERIIPDNTTGTPLLHGVIEPTFKFS